MRPRLMNRSRIARRLTKDHIDIFKLPCNGIVVTILQVIIILMIVVAILEIGSSDDEPLPLVNIPTDPVVLRVRKGALVMIICDDYDDSDDDDDDGNDEDEAPLVGDSPAGFEPSYQWRAAAAAHRA